MITFGIKSYVNNISKITNNFDLDKANFLKDVKKDGLSNINSETPIRTGELKSGNSADIKTNDVEFYNKVDYFIFVHGGTTYQSANPFLLRGLTKSSMEFKSSLIGNLRV